jgi:hypothetical protein
MIPLEAGCQDHKYCCKTCEEYTKKGSCMFLTNLCESKFITPVDKSDYENGEGMFINADYRNLIGCLGCLSHSSLRHLSTSQKYTIGAEELEGLIEAISDTTNEHFASEESKISYAKEIEKDILLRSPHMSPNSLSNNNTDKFLCGNEVHRNIAKRTRDKTLNEIYKQLKKMHYSMWQSPQSYGQKEIVEWQDIKDLFKKLGKKK